MTQGNLFDTVQATHRKPSQAKRMLAALRARGDHGVTNVEFVTTMHILNYKGRKHELSRDGYDIEVKKTPEKGKGVYTYYYRGEI